MRKILRTILAILNAILSGVLLIQAVLVLQFLFLGYVSIPAAVLGYAHPFAGMRISAESIRIYPWSRLELKELRVQLDGYRGPLLRIPDLVLNCADPARCLSPSNPVYGSIREAQLYYPERLLPEASGTVLLDQVSLDFEVEEGWLSIENIQGSLARLAVYSHRPLKVRLPEGGKGGDTRLSVRESDLDAIRELLVLHRLFEDAEQSSLRLVFRESEAGIRSVSFDLSSEGFRYNDDYVASDAYLGGEVSFESGSAIRDTLNGRIQSVRYKDLATVKDISIGLHFSRDGVVSFIPELAEVHARRLLYSGESFYHGALKVWLSDPRQMRFEAMASLRGECLRLEGEVDSYLGDGRLRTEGWIDPSRIQACRWIRDAGRSDSVCFGAPVYVKADLGFRQFKWLEGLSFSMQGTDMDLSGVPVSYGFLSGNKQGELFCLDSFMARIADYTIRGSLERNTRTTDYRYLIHGHMDPRDFTPWFEPWWSETWSRFGFGTLTPEVNLDIWGRQSDRNRRDVFGQVNLEAMRFRGLPIDRGQVRVRYRRGMIDIYDIDIRNHNGTALGSVRSVYSDSSSDVISRRIHIASDIPVWEAKGLVGSILDPYIDKLGGEPRISYKVDGCVIMESHPEFNHLYALDVEIDVPGVFEFAGVSGSNGSILIHRNADSLILDPIRFDFAGGLAEGSCLVMDAADGRNPIRFDGVLTGIDTRLARDGLSGLRQEMGLVPDADAVDAIEPDTRNELSLTAWGEGILGIPESFTAEGEFVLIDPLITCVHVFGVFSRILDALQLGIGSFTLNEATGAFSYEKDRLDFSSLRMTGPSSRVEARGYWDRLSNEMDFRLKSYPLQELNIPLISQIALVLVPISHVFEVRVWGTPDDPQWRLILDPSSL
ncbi:MAG TPA: hypothetical protein PKX94_00225 [Opitutales bacterium]|nr:hypothetical protein [Opitutales bacterium]